MWKDAEFIKIVGIEKIDNKPFTPDDLLEAKDKGRKGKTVSTVSGFQIKADKLKNLATELKRLCGTGGSVKNGVIILQGDHRETLIAELKKKGYTAKIAGG